MVPENVPSAELTATESTLKRFCATLYCMSAMRIEYAGYASAKAFVIAGLMNLFTRGLGKSRTPSTQTSTIPPMAKHTYHAIFSGDRRRRSVGGSGFCICSFTMFPLPRSRRVCLLYPGECRRDHLLRRNAACNQGTEQLLQLGVVVAPSPTPMTHATSSSALIGLNLSSALLSPCSCWGDIYWQVLHTLS